MDATPPLRRIARAMHDLLPRTADCHRRRDAVSQWSVGQQLDHILKVNDGIVDTLTQAMPPEPISGSATLTGRFVLLIGRIPRGQGVTPERRAGVDDVQPAELATRITKQAARQAAAPWRTDAGILGRSFAHPAFGVLHGRQWLCFMEIHVQHHQRIITDILRCWWRLHAWPLFYSFYFIPSASPSFPLSPLPLISAGRTRPCARC